MHKTSRTSSIEIRNPTFPTLTSKPLQASHNHQSIQHQCFCKELQARYKKILFITNEKSHKTLNSFYHRIQSFQAYLFWKKECKKG
jgi:hypothetical protein